MKEFSIAGFTMEGEHDREKTSGLWSLRAGSQPNSELKGRDLSPAAKGNKFSLTTWMTLQLNSSPKSQLRMRPTEMRHWSEDSKLSQIQACRTMNS